MKKSVILAKVLEGAVAVAPPAQPTGLTATPASTSQINLAWTDVATDETAYRVYRSTDGSSYAQVGTDLAAGSTSYSDTTITAGTKYYYKVAAVNAGGETLSDAATATTLTLNILAYWKLDETTGSRLDSVGTRLLTVVNTVGNTTGKISNCATMATGAQNWLVTNSDASLQAITWADGFTVFGWVYIPTAFTVSPTVLAKHQAGSNLDWTLYINSINLLHFNVQDSSSGSSVAIDTTTLQVDTWYFLVGRYNPATKKAELQLNAGTNRLGTALTNGPKNTYDRLAINRSFSSFATARYDEVGIYTRYITDAEVTALHNGGAGQTYPF